jgi:hypothetical protein
MSENAIGEVARLLVKAHGSNAQVLASRAAALLKEDVDMADQAAWWESVLGVIQKLLEGEEPGNSA